MKHPIFDRLKNYIQHPQDFLLALALHGIIPMSDRQFLEIQFKHRLGYPLNLDNPRTFNEKIQWLKLYDRCPEYVTMVNKYAVKQYVADKIGEEYVIPTIGVWDKFEDIDFGSLPNQFVLKCTHDSGSVVICEDKRKFDYNEARRKLTHCLSIDYYKLGREWVYKNVPRKIIAEKYMFEGGWDESDRLMDYSCGGRLLTDYKLMCFGGKVKCLFVCTERGVEGGLKVTFFDRDWNVLPFERHYPKSSKKISRPSCLDEMILLAERLSEGIPFVRVDFYEIDGHLYFGEFTFYPGNGTEEFRPEDADLRLGQMITLPGEMPINHLFGQGNMLQMPDK